jgi:Tfp pilus assembly protein PilX
MAGNTQKHNITLQTAETALRYAEAQLQQGIYTNFSANANGLYNCNPSCTTSGTPWYLAPPSVLTYNGPSLSSNADQSGSAPSPTYIIENLPVVALPGSNAATSGSYGSNGTPPVVLYRITAYGTGADHTSQVLLQSIFY